jgi:ParB-like chromosome segregation protein Spo0J
VAKKEKETPQKIVQKPIDSLIPYARNSRTHADGQIAQIAGLIKEFGWTNPVLVDEDNGIVAGHGRVLAARKLGLTEVPCIELRGMTETQKRAYVIADNKVAINSGWDYSLLEVEFDDLEASGFDLELTGFSLITLVGVGFNLDKRIPEKPRARRDLLADQGESAVPNLYPV